MGKKMFTKEFKMQVVHELLAGKRPTELAREHDIKIDAICRWRKAFEQNPQHAFAGNGNPSTQETKEAQLERKIGQLTMEMDFIKKVNANLQKALAESKKNAK